jgi:hypothetical protein
MLPDVSSLKEVASEHPVEEQLPRRNLWKSTGRAHPDARFRGRCARARTATARSNLRAVLSVANRKAKMSPAREIPPGAVIRFYLQST